ncbi:hypothetical protein [Solirubrum puertoriconensis]|uniref:Uncharacterized protein n=1 Tax=Solirubrum puertoriconensis TaxID=1751427 RepID=A0A9X0HM01_SOLP1|nr:hypothetical protein [Solirubrum puertoriconensis]KUG08336.1 hypothetical protein ASU33_09185 [Solirubrum puertoriconensis]
MPAPDTTELEQTLGQERAPEAALEEALTDLGQRLFEGGAFCKLTSCSLMTAGVQATKLSNRF